MSKGFSYCNVEQGGNDNDDQQFNLDEAGRCKRLDVDKEAFQYYMYNNGANYNNYNFYGNGDMGLYVGPYCSTNGKRIMLGTLTSFRRYCFDYCLHWLNAIFLFLLGVFMDETCSYAADQKIVKNFGLSNYLPYHTQSLIDSGCISCKEPQDYNDQNYNDQQDEDQITDVCERLYKGSGKCETKVASASYPVTYGCDFIKSLKASGTRRTSNNAAVPARVFATLFAVTTAIFGGVAYHLHQKVQRSSGVNLNPDQDGQLA